MLVGLLIFTGSTLMLCLGRTIWLLLGGRILQGAAAAVVWSSGLALLVDTVGNDQIGAAIGWVTLGISIGLFLSPLLGGIVFDRSGFVSVFGIAFALLFLDLLLRLFMVERRTFRGVNRVDGSNSQIEIPGRVETSDGHITDPSSQQDQSRTDSSNHASKSLARHLVAFISRTCRLLASRRLSTGLWGIFVQAAVMTSLDGVRSSLSPIWQFNVDSFQC
jgi:MFS family permease